MPAGAGRLTPERGARDPVPVTPDACDLFRAGGRIGGLRALRPIGPRGNVWLAADRSGRQLALKAGPRPAIAHEFRVLSALRHRHIVRAVDAVESGGALILVLEHLAGGDLVSVTGLAPRHWRSTLVAVIEALALMHRTGYAHRDLKARHVMFDRAGQARLIDFGSAARIGSPWTAAGTTAEAVVPGRGAAPVHAGDDVAALAALTFELLHGAPPGPGRERPGAPPALSALIAAALEPGAPERVPALDRFASVIKSLPGSEPA